MNNKRLLLILLTTMLVFLNSVSILAENLEWGSSYQRQSDNQYVASAVWTGKPVSKDSIVTKIEASITGFPADNKPGVDVCLFIYRHNEPYYYESMTGGFSEVICTHADRSGDGSPWSWQVSPGLFVPSGSEISCGSTMWSGSGIFPESFGNFNCAVTLSDASGQASISKTGMRSLRFPYIDQMTNPALPKQRLGGESGQPPWVGYKSNNDFPLKVKNAAFFVGFQPKTQAGLNMCVYWIKNGKEYQKKCIPYQSKQADANHDGYSQLLDLNWDIPPGDELYGHCTYYGGTGSNSDCVIYAFVELPNDKKNYQGLFTNYGLIDVSKAHDYCYDPFNSESFAGPYFDTDASKKCMDILRLYDPIEVTLSSDKSQGNIGEEIKLTAQPKRGLNLQYKFWYFDGTNYLMLRDWGVENSFTTAIKKQGVNQYGVHIKDTGRDYGSDYPDIWAVAQSWIEVNGSQKCSNEGEFCGGVGIKCCSGLKCQLDGTYPGASGKCVKEVTGNCTDSDGGKNYYEKGSCVDSDGELVWDSCKGWMLREMYCTEDKECSVFEHLCPYGCEGGACIINITSCTSAVDNCCFSEEDNTCDPDCDEGKDPDCAGCTPKSGDCCDFSDDGICDSDCSKGKDPDCGEVGCNNNKICELSRDEDSMNCSNDCYCGDGVCDPAETAKTCAKDCGYCTPEWECRLEPVTCPKEGLQNKVCVDVKCGTEEKRVEALKCVPGTCTGCLANNICYSETTRVLLNKIPSYCDVTKKFLKQKDLGAPCQNNYECLSNECSDGECISLKKELEETQSLLQKILDWLKKIF